ncbi:hypothetical protein SGRIM128S_03118 [Streptomyces griseomycini]
MCLSAGSEDLDGHRRVIGEPPEPLGPRVVQSLKSLVQNPCRIHGRISRKDIPAA